jgi:acetyl-CoA synthetase
MLTNIPGAQKMKPAFVGLPFFGTKPMILDQKSGQPVEGEAQGVLVYANPWPGIARTVYGDHQRYNVGRRKKERKKPKRNETKKRKENRR